MISTLFTIFPTFLPGKCCLKSRVFEGVACYGRNNQKYSKKLWMKVVPKVRYK
jgi:hypothetical protein